MATSGTYTFNPETSDIISEAYNLCGIRQGALTVQHMESARFYCNMILQQMSVDGLNLWAMEQVSIPLTMGTQSYTLDTSTITVMDIFLRYQGRDIVMSPMSRTDYAALPDKSSVGRPSMYWFERTNAPKLWLWKPANANAAYTLYYWRMRRLQDSSYENGENVDVNYRILYSFFLQLGAHLALAWAPDRHEKLQGLANSAWVKAHNDDKEDVSMHITPNLAGYFR